MKREGKRTQDPNLQGRSAYESGAESVKKMAGIVRE
jgi:hypothetical protein